MKTNAIQSTKANKLAGHETASALQAKNASIKRQQKLANDAKKANDEANKCFADGGELAVTAQQQKSAVLEFVAIRNTASTPFTSISWKAFTGDNKRGEITMLPCRALVGFSVAKNGTVSFKILNDFVCRKGAADGDEIYLVRQFIKPFLASRNCKAYQYYAHQINDLQSAYNEAIGNKLVAVNGLFATDNTGMPVRKSLVFLPSSTFKAKLLRLLAKNFVGSRTYDNVICSGISPNIDFCDQQISSAIRQLVINLLNDVNNEIEDIYAIKRAFIEIEAQAKVNKEAQSGKETKTAKVTEAQK